MKYYAMESCSGHIWRWFRLFVLCIRYSYVMKLSVWGRGMAPRCNQIHHVAAPCNGARGEVSYYTHDLEVEIFNVVTAAAFAAGLRSCNLSHYLLGSK